MAIGALLESELLQKIIEVEFAGLVAEPVDREDLGEIVKCSDVSIDLFAGCEFVEVGVLGGGSTLPAASISSSVGRLQPATKGVSAAPAAVKPIDLRKFRRWRCRSR